MGGTAKLTACRIGVFDSGVGGLTVVERLFAEMPGLTLHYFGDTAHVPYGERSAEEVRRLVRAIARHLCLQQAQALVLACNTSSALALEMLRHENVVPVVGMIDAAARAAVELTNNGRIGVLSNPLTARSGAYERAVAAFDSAARVFPVGCPKLVPLIESGQIDSLAARQAVHEYLTPLLRRKVDTIVLGCTHYPFLRRVIEMTAGPEVQLIDPAAYVGAELARLGIRSGTDAAMDHCIEVSGCPLDFERNGSRLLGRLLTAVKRVELFPTQVVAAPISAVAG